MPRTLAPTLWAISLIAGLPLTAWAQTSDTPTRDFRYYHGPGMMWGGDYWGGFGMVLGPIFMVLLLVGLVVGIFLVLRALGLTSSGVMSNRPADSALAILKERYARGEIDSKEFEERKRLLVD
jgi:putative membrane protein